MSSPLLVNYRCVKHTWACMQPMLEYGPLGDPVWQNDPGALDGGFAQPPNRVNCTHEQEKDGFLVSWLSSRTEPWLLLRLNEQTALEPSGPAAAAVLSGAWPGPGISASAVPDTATAGAAPPPFWHGRRYATHACGCLSTRLDLLSRLRAVQKKGPASSSGDDCVVDKHGSRGVWRPSNRPTDPKELAAYQAVAQLPYARGMRSLRRLRRGPRNIAFATACEAYSVLRPRRWLQRAMLPLLQKLTTATGGGPLIGVHLRSGFADWQWYSSTHIRAGVGANGVKANRQWEQALNAGPLSYDKHWKAFEAMLYDCKESITNDGTAVLQLADSALWESARSKRRGAMRRRAFKSGQPFHTTASKEGRRLLVTKASGMPRCHAKVLLPMVLADAKQRHSSRRCRVQPSVCDRTGRSEDVA